MQPVEHCPVEGLPDAVAVVPAQGQQGEHGVVDAVGGGRGGGGCGVGLSLQPCVDCGALDARPVT